MIETAQQTYGGLHVMFNNAATSIQRTLITEFSEEYFDQVISVNLKGVFLGMQYGIPLIVESGGGSVSIPRQSPG